MQLVVFGQSMIACRISDANSLLGAGDHFPDIPLSRVSCIQDKFGATCLPSHTEFMEPMYATPPSAGTHPSPQWTASERPYSLVTSEPRISAIISLRSPKKASSAQHKTGCLTSRLLLERRHRAARGALRLLD